MCLVSCVFDLKLEMKMGSAMLAWVALLAAAWAAGVEAQQGEDRPLPPSPCPGVFSYEGATVDWDRWYGVVLVATDTPLTGLRLDVWLSRPALALRHNWDGNVTTLDNKRFTILNLYKRIEPGPPRSIRIIVKFDEDEDIPFLQTIEMNGRRICGGRTSYDDQQQPPSHHRPEYPMEIALSEHHAPSNKYDFDRTTARSPYDSYDPYEQDYKNAVSRRPASPVAADSRPTAAAHGAHRPAASGTYDASVEYRPRPTYPVVEPETYSKPKQPQYEVAAPPSRRQPAYEGVPQGHSKPSSGGGGKQQGEDQREVGPPMRGPPEHAPPRPEPPRQDPPRYEPPARQDPPRYEPKPHDTSSGDGRYKTTRRPDYRKPVTAEPLGYGSGETTRSPTYHHRERPAEAGRVPSVEGQGSRPVDPIDVRLGPQPLSDEHDVEGYYGEEARPPPAEARPQKPNRRPPEQATTVPSGHKVPATSNNQNGDRIDSTQSSTYKPDSTPPPIRHSGGGDDLCGRTLSVTPLITSGQNTSRGQWPWHAALYQVKGTDLKYICGGTLISPKYVVTAAHCVTRSTTGRAVDPDTVIAYLGKYHLNRWTNEEGVQQGKVAAIYVHPNYNTSSFRADLALLELSTPMTYTQFVRHVCLWSRDEPVALNHIVNKEGYVVGWGYDEYGELTEELRMAAMPIVSEQTCLRSYAEFYTRFTNERSFCGGYRNGTSACNGDSGGGMVLPRFSGNAKVWYLRGLVSVSVSRDDQRVCNTKHFVVFTDLAKYRDWIDSYIR